MNKNEFDIQIIGAGLSGLFAAYALSKKGLSIALIDKNHFLDNKSLNFDFRTTAISEGSKIIFENLDIWKKLSNFSQTIKKIIIFDRNELNSIDFINPDNESYLGYIIKNKHIKNVLIKELQKRKNIKFFDNSNIKEVKASNDYITSYTDKKTIISKLLIAADGKNSFVRKLLKTKIFQKKYNQKAFVINISHSKNHKEIAYELFYKNGPLAILPMKQESKKFFYSSIVWSNSVNFFNDISKLDNKDIIFILENEIEKYIGKIIDIKNKKIFDLSAHVNSSFYENRIVYLGDSAHSIHPIAGQGWNLGIRDIDNLLSVIDEALYLGLDLGSYYICKKYNNKSYNDAFMLYQITDKLNHIFMIENKFISKARGVGIDFINRNKKLNHFISSYAMGKNTKKFSFF